MAVLTFNQMLGAQPLPNIGQGLVFQYNFMPTTAAGEGRILDAKMLGTGRGMTGLHEQNGISAIITMVLI